MTDQTDTTRNYEPIEDKPVRGVEEYSFPLPVSANYVVDGEGVHEVQHEDRSYYNDEELKAAIETEVQLSPEDRARYEASREDVDPTTEETPEFYAALRGGDARQDDEVFLDGVDDDLENNVTTQPADVKPAPEGEEDVTAEPETPLRTSERIPLIMNRKDDAVVVGTAVVTVFTNRAEIHCELGGSEEAGEAAGLFSSNIIGGISMGAILSEEAQIKLAEHLNSKK